MRVRLPLILALGLVVLLALAGAAAAAPSAFWTSDGSAGLIGTAPLGDPAAVDMSLYAAGPKTGRPAGILGYDGYLYWTAQTTDDPGVMVVGSGASTLADEPPHDRSIYRAPADGAGPVQRIADTCGQPLRLAQANGWLYWSDAATPAIGRLRLGADPRRVAVRLLAPDCSWASLGAGERGRDLWTNGRSLFWPTTSGGGAIGAMLLASRVPNTMFIEDRRIDAATALTGLGGFLYWTAGNGDLVRAATTAAATPMAIGTAGRSPRDIATDGTAIYWSTPDGRSIGRMQVNGAMLQEPYIRAAAGGSNAIVDIAVDPAPTIRVSVEASTGGSVDSAPSGIDCPRDCVQAFANGSTVSLAAHPDAGWEFSGWSAGDGSAPICAGSDALCEFEADQTVTVVATFTRAERQTLEIVSAGDRGTVTSIPGGIVCPLACTASFAPGTVVSLAAVPAAGYVLAAWQVEPASAADCKDVAQACRILLDEAAAVTPVFEPQPAPGPTRLTISFTGSGGGAVQIPDHGACAADAGSCSWTFDRGSVVSLAEVADATSNFAGWFDVPQSASCPRDAQTCSLVLIDDTTIVVRFDRSIGPVPTETRVVVRGAGIVRAADSGFECAATCTEEFPAGTSVSLIAVPQPGNVFVGWSGDAVGSPDCGATATICTFVTGGAPNQIEAAFADAPGPTPDPFPGPTPGPKPAPSPAPAPVPGPNQGIVQVDKVGTPAGIVYSEPAGVACWPNCTVPFTAETTVTLVAREGVYGDFIGWTGPCTGVIVTCHVTVGPRSRVGAMFINSGVLRLVDYRLGPRAIRVGPRSTATRARVPTMARISYRLSENAKVTIRVVQFRPLPARGRKPKAYVITRRDGFKGGKAGLNVIDFSGRIGRKRLTAGVWRIWISASDGTTTTTPVKRAFRILRG